MFALIIGQLPDQFDIPSFISGCQKSKMPYFFESLGQHMKQEPPDELHSIKGHLLCRIVLGSVFPGKYHSTVFKGFDPVIGDGDSVSVASEILKYLFRA